MRLKDSYRSLLEEGTKRILVLCVDLDDDVGRKTGLETPIIGRENVLRAAEKLALLDPEEADSNAMFASIRLSDDFSQSGHLAEVCVVSGLKDGGLEASRKAVEEIMRVANSFPPSEVYVVTDGFGEEDIEPVLKARLPLAGVRRIVVKQSRAIEESYIILGRYLKMLFTDPRFKRWFLGIGGFLITSLTLLSYFGSYREVNTMFWSLIGIVVLMKGLDLDKRISSGLRQIYGENLPPAMLTCKTLFLFTGIALILFTIYTGIYIEHSAEESFMELVGKFIAQVADIFLFGASLILVSNALKYPLKIPSIRESLTILANMMSLTPLIKTLGIAASTPFFELRILLYVSLLTLLLMYAANVLTFLLTRLTVSVSKIFKIALEE
jgi:putative membrane protein